MPPKGGKKGRRGANKDTGFSRELLIKEDGQEYAQITRILGNGRFECRCFDGQTRIGKVRGKMNKRVWIENGNLVLVGLRDYQDGKGDIFHKFTDDEARKLKNLGELPSDFIAKEVKEGEEDEECSFEFDTI
ncbi:MAG: translation initiation factor eIF-1A [Candidatus Colwellbacteria bacterium]|nr:translation initiation factor eIF-1A [Candidatus Colwellbacteria bacterium]